MAKRRISLLLVAFMVLTMAMPLNAYGEVNDYTGHWAESTIQQWLNKGQISGYPDGTFKPDGKVTRAEFVKMVNGAFNYTETSTIEFSDVKSGDWYYQEVQKAFKAGFIAGISETQFAPNNNLTREQAAVIISRINKLDENSAAAEVFSDYGIISSYAKGGVGAAAKAEIIKGYNDNSFKPQNPITRAEAIVILDRAIGAGSEQAEDLTVDKSGTTVENVTVKNIHITDKVGNGEVTLKNVKVTGELLVEGGGQNSIIIENSDIKNLTVDKADGKVRILLKGSSSIGSTTLESGATLEQKDLKGDGFGDVEISKDANTKHTVIITADVDTLNVNAKIKINVKSGTIDEIVVSDKAVGATVNLSKNVVVKSLTINAKVEFTGTGTIEKAYVNVNGVTFEQKPKTMTVAKGIDEPKIVESSTGGGGSGGGGGGYEEPNYVTLTGLEVEGGTLKPEFDSATTSYTAITTQSAITIIAETSTKAAITVTVTGTGITADVTTESGIATINVKLAELLDKEEVEGSITLHVTSEGYKAQEYIINVVRKPN